MKLDGQDIVFSDQNDNVAAVTPRTVAMPKQAVLVAPDDAPAVLDEVGAALEPLALPLDDPLGVPAPPRAAEGVSTPDVRGITEAEEAPEKAGD